MWRRLSLWIPVAAFMLAVLLLPTPAARPIHVVLWDKASHAIAFLVFGWFCLRAFHGGVVPLRRTAVGAALLLACGFGALDEWQQTMRPGRFGSALDAVADGVGALAAIPLFALCARILDRRPGEARRGER